MLIKTNPLDLFIETHRKNIEMCLNTLVPGEECLEKKMYEAARYSLLGGGKRLRPLLCLSVVETFHGNITKALIPACALEFIHTYSLIHDDLPCMDDDDFRRGKPSLHKAYSEGLAVLTGDFLLTHAFGLLADVNLSAEMKIELISLLNKGAGGRGMIGGQVIDIENNDSLIDFPTLMEIHFKKTGCMFLTAIEFGSVISEVNEKERQVLRDFGNFIGMAYQIMDDLLDSIEEGSDQANDKKTCVTLIGKEKSIEMVKSFLNEAHKALKKLSVEAPLLENFIHLISDTNLNFG